MKRLKTPVLFTLLGASLFLNFIGCQKQKEIDNPQQVQKQTNKSTLTAGRIIGDVDRDYSISMDKAIRYTTRFRDNKTAAEPIGYKVPVGGILQVLKRAQDNNIDISHITFYQAIDDEGKRMVVYVATKPDGKDVLEYTQPETINGITTTTINAVCDLSLEVATTSVTNPNVLNTK